MATKAPPRSERRQSQRYDLPVRLKLSRTESGPGPAEEHTVANNLGAGGAMVFSSLAVTKGERVIIVAVEDQHHPFVAVAIGRQRRVVDQEPDIGPVRVALLDRENDGLVLRIAGALYSRRDPRIVQLALKVMF